MIFTTKKSNRRISSCFVLGSLLNGLLNIALAQYPAPNILDQDYTGNPYVSAGDVGQCTWYVYGRIQETKLMTSNELAAAKNRKDGTGIFLNSADTWPADATAAGLSVGTTPAVGAIAAWTNGKPHVAFVESVNPDGSFNVTECNGTPRAGATAVVGGNNLRLRRTATTTGDIVATVPQFTLLPVIGGPVSAGGYQWFQFSDGGTPCWGAWLTYDLSAPADPNTFDWNFTQIHLTPSPSFKGAASPPDTFIYLVPSQSTSLAIMRAVQISFPSEDGKLYQLYVSQDLKTWTAYDQPVTGNGGQMSLPFTADKGTQYWKVQQVPGNATDRIPGLSDLNLAGAVFTPSDSGFSVADMRANSSVSTLNDLIRADFTFDSASQVFRLATFDIAGEIGVFHDPYFAKDVAPDIFLYKTLDSQMSMDSTYHLTSSGESYYMDLSVGDVVSFLIQAMNDDMTLKISGPDGDEILNEIVSANAITGAKAILKTGRYTVQFIPVNNSTVSFSVYFLNANRKSLATIINGSVINVSFDNNIRDYGKYVVSLQARDLLSLDQPSDNNIELTLLSFSSELLAQDIGLPLKYIAKEAGNYYVFIDNQNGWGGSYYGTVSIKHGVGPASPGTSSGRHFNAVQSGASRPSATAK
ncbi:MAG: CHAP domain-containing protein [Verrucomicrobiota bacterium]